MRIIGLRGRPRTVGPAWPALIAIAAVLALAGCSGGAEAPSVARDREAVTQARPDAGEAGGAGADGDSAAAGNAADEAGESGERPLTKATVAPEDRQLVRSAEMTVRAKDVAAAAEKATRIATEAGGYVSEEHSTSSADGDSHTLITFKVPPDRYAAVLARFGKELGTRESLTQRTEDVTEQVADVESRIKSAEATIDQFRALLRRAEKIGEILDIEREISQRTAELESLQARRKALASLTGMATITLRLVGPAAKPPREEDDGPAGFLGGLAAGWAALVAAVEIGLTVLGVLLPWLVAIGLLVLLVWPLRHRLDRIRPGPPRPRRPHGPQPGTPPEPAGARPPEAAAAGVPSGPEEAAAAPQDPDAEAGRGG